MSLIAVEFTSMAHSIARTYALTPGPPEAVPGEPRHMPSSAKAAEAGPPVRGKFHDDAAPLGGPGHALGAPGLFLDEHAGAGGAQQVRHPGPGDDRRSAARTHHPRPLQHPRMAAAVPGLDVAVR